MEVYREELSRVKLSGRRKRELLKFLKRLREELGVEEVYLFGSRVYGTPLADSDLDMIVVSEKFREKSFIENTRKPTNRQPASHLPATSLIPKAKALAQ